MEVAKFKICPYCELNYIPITDCCCEICYKNSTVARKAAIEQRRKEREEKNHKLIEQKNIKEKQDKEKILEVWRNLGFIGFLHTTNFENFVKIYNSTVLKSRRDLLSEGIIFNDNAEGAVLDKTSDFIKSKARFYYRPITPTNISAYICHGQKNPVLIVFDENLIFRDDILFCDGCAGSMLTRMVKNTKWAIKFDWESIFSTGPFNSDDIILKNHRNAEFLTSSPVSLEKAIKFYFKNYSDYVNACKLLGNDNRFEYEPKLFY